MKFFRMLRLFVVAFIVWVMMLLEELLECLRAILDISAAVLIMLRDTIKEGG